MRGFFKKIIYVKYLLLWAIFLMLLLKIKQLIYFIMYLSREINIISVTMHRYNKIFSMKFYMWTYLKNIYPSTRIWSLFNNVVVRLEIPNHFILISQPIN